MLLYRRSGRRSTASIVMVGLVLTALLLPGLAQALTYGGKTWTEVDWMAPGDGKLTKDETTGRYWLDLSEITLDWFDLQTALNPGGMFEGLFWQVIKRSWIIWDNTMDP